MAVRLRNAFRYPEDSGDERDELDEEEQERVILQLQRQNETRNAQYSTWFTGIPLISTLAFLPSLLSGGIPERFWSLLALLSLLSTAYIMRTTALHPDRKGKKPVSVGEERLARFRTVLIPVNGVACLVLTIVYFGFLRSVSTYAIRPVLYLIPGVMFAVVLLAREVMLSVDLTALKDLQYEYKGA